MMTVSKMCTHCASLCKLGMFLIPLGLVGQISFNLSYITPSNYVFYFGVAFIVTFVFLRAFCVMASRTDRGSDYEEWEAYSPAVAGLIRLDGL